MAVTVTQIGSATGTGATVNVALSTNVTTSDLLVVTVCQNTVHSFAAQIPTTSRGDTFAEIDDAGVNATKAFRVGMWALQPTLALTAGTHTVDMPGWDNIAIKVYLITGISTYGGIDASVNGTSGTSTSPTSNSMSSSQADEVLFAVFGWDSASAQLTPPSSPWTAGNTLANASTESLKTVYQVVTATGSYSATGTLSVSADWAACIGGLKVTPSGGAPPAHAPIRLVTMSRAVQRAASRCDGWVRDRNGLLVPLGGLAWRG